MNNNKKFAAIVAGLVILVSVVSHQLNNVIHVTLSFPSKVSQYSPSKVSQSSQIAQMDQVTLFSKEEIIGKLPSIYPGDLDASTTGSCGLGVMLPWKLPSTLAD